MEIKPQLFMAKTMHRRFFPRENRFIYRVYYLALPLSTLDALESSLVFSVDKPALLSFYRKDHGARDGGDLNLWAKSLFAKHGINCGEDDIVLVAMPRVLGFVFNPVSFWFCYEGQKNIRAVIAEVNNTFGETHSYLCANPDGAPLDPDSWVGAEKLFHVSPFLERKGNYAFRFKTEGNALAVWIDYFPEEGRKQLATSLIGEMIPLTKAALLKAFFAIPWVTMKAILLIHWQALVLVGKRLRYIDKPPQKDIRDSVTNLTKM